MSPITSPVSWPEVRTDQLPVMDWTFLRDLKRVLGPNSDDVLNTIIDTFLETAPMRARELTHAANHADRGACRRTAHALKGTSASFGAARVADAADRLFDAAGRGAASGELSEIATEIREELFDVIDAVEDLPSDLR